VLRGINSSPNWIANQSRPDLAVQTSLGQQRFPNPTISSFRDANTAVRRAKQHKDLAIRFQQIQPSRLTLCCHSGAANIGAHTPAGYVISFVDKNIQKGAVSPWVPVLWCSYKLPRAVSSMLGGGAQAMSTASGTAEWLTLLVLEVFEGTFALRESRNLLQKRPPIYATDCTSLYDHLVSPSAPTMIVEPALTWLSFGSHCKQHVVPCVGFQLTECWLMAEPKIRWIQLTCSDRASEQVNIKFPLRN
jgi:hypothetical protein